MRLVELVGVISLAADAGTGSPEDFGLRAGTLAVRIGALIGAPPATQADAMYLTLLRYSGCTAEGHTAASVMGDEVDLGRENFGTDWGNPREMLPVLLRHVRKGKGTLGGIAAMAQTLARMASMMEVGKAHCEVAIDEDRRPPRPAHLREARGDGRDRQDALDRRLEAEARAGCTSSSTPAR